MKRIVVAYTLSLITAWLIFPNQPFAATKIFEREYTYQAGEADSKLSCRTIALEQVKRLLLEELGTYLESETKVRDFQLTTDQITTLTAGIVRTEILSEKWNGEVYRLFARIEADPNQVVEAISRLLQNREQNKNLEESRARAEQYLKEIERLNKELMIAKGDAFGRKQLEYLHAVELLSAEDWFERGFSFDESGRSEEALKAYTKAIETNSRYIAAYNNRGNIWKEKGDFERSFNDFNKIVEIDPGAVFGYLGRGNALSEKGDFYKAIIDYNKALEINPNLAEAYHNRGFTLAKLGDRNQAIVDYTKAIEINPRYTDAYIDRGNAWGKKGDLERAIADYTRALEINPRLVSAWRARGAAWLMKDDINQALADARKALRLRPNDKVLQGVVADLETLIRRRKN